MGDVPASIALVYLIVPLLAVFCISLVTFIFVRLKIIKDILILIGTSISAQVIFITLTLNVFKSSHEIFWLFTLLLAIPFFVLGLIHGKLGYNWVLASLFLYLVETIFELFTLNVFSYYSILVMSVIVTALLIAVKYIKNTIILILSFILLATFLIGIIVSLLL
ncbi:hypothetical protein KY321_03945 [Candidatus Woesearchaeota archaeon]|nr:hypothetical protein [Candidatus Woesearchaeota archaeon]